MVAPTAVRFNTDHYILGSTYRCAMAIKSYPTKTDELALLRRLGEKSGVTLRAYMRRVTPAEENAILHNASSRSRMERSNTDNLKQSVTAEADFQDVVTLITTMQRNQEPLVHCSVFLELCARDTDGLKTLKDEVTAELARSKLGVDLLLLRQKDGFLSVNPFGSNHFGSQFERVLPATSVGNLFPFNYSGKTDPQGFYIGRDKYGSNIIVDLDRRAEDKTTGSALILGNSGQGKSWLLKLILCNILESGKNVICLDPEHELVELCARLGGCFIDLMDGGYKINPLEPKLWSDDKEVDESAPAPFRQKTLLSQHISFLKDFFRSYKSFEDRHIDTIEIMAERLYLRFGITDNTDFSKVARDGYPILSDLYSTIENAYRDYDREENPLYTRELLQEILLGLHSMCKGAESRFFNGHTNVASDRFVVFGVKGLLQSGGNVKDAMLFQNRVVFDIGGFLHLHSLQPQPLFAEKSKPVAVVRHRQGRVVQEGGFTLCDFFLCLLIGLAVAEPIPDFSGQLIPFDITGLPASVFSLKNVFTFSCHSNHHADRKAVGTNRNERVLTSGRLSYKIGVRGGSTLQRTVGRVVDGFRS
ncbi:helicase HerA domain-containing protein [uncultured Dysosmobacter sp.]|uniref:helicase HerA domain-containing protein n=1 Tax=uncultured Dysosmobacter sp. TaxID=2591384 RepID=UPI00260D7D98|nr:DUF87 domain-containing protein [uncultured Dysosmobacter sp.]